MTNKKAKGIIAHYLRKVLNMPWAESHRVASLYAKEGYYMGNLREKTEEEIVGSVVIALTHFNHNVDFEQYGISVDSKLILGTYADPEEVLVDSTVYKDGEFMFSDWY